MDSTIRPRRILFEYTQAAVIALMFSLGARTFLFQAFRIPSPSMEDTLLVGDHILVNKFVTAPLSYPFERALLPIAEVGRGDVAIFRYPDDPRQDYVKRVIGLPGESLQIINGIPYVKSAGEAGFAALIEPYIRPTRPDRHPDRLDNFGPIEVPAGHYFVMGDNRDDSLDSREWGFVPRENIVGRALLVYWSIDGVDEAGARAAAREPESGVRRLLDGTTGLFRRTRWERAGQVIR